MYRFYELSFIFELYDLDLSVIIEKSGLDNPLSCFFDMFLIIDIWDPYFNGLNFLSDFGPDAIDEVVSIYVQSYKSKHNVFPNLVTFIFEESQDESTSLLVLGIFPNWLYISLEQIEVGVMPEGTWSIAVLIHSPEIRNVVHCCNIY